MKKMPGDIILLHMCTRNEGHMINGSWNIRYNRQNVLSFWAIFWPFTPWQLGKSKFWKIEKKHQEISSFYKSVTAQKMKFSLMENFIVCAVCTKKAKMAVIWCMVPLGYGVRQTEFFSFWTIFCPFNPPPPLKTQKIKKI